MRLSEKSIEINLCSQLPQVWNRRVLWFGLTQTQEARAGFDACTRLNGRILLLQFKASSVTLASGARRFALPHRQLDALVRQVSSFRRHVFYVFPLIGTTLELTRNPFLPTNTWFLDVASIPPMPAPTTRHGTLRQNGHHYCDVSPGRATIHSDPVNVELLDSEAIVSEVADGRGDRSKQDITLLEMVRPQLGPHSKVGILV
jgi:hypothetical protein